MLRRIRDRTIDAVEPPHWKAEIISVIARERPQRVSLTLGILATLPFTERAPIGCYRRAANISIELSHHLFDTLYHALALEEGATLVTADEVYFAKAKNLGSICRLAEFAI